MKLTFALTVSFLLTSISYAGNDDVLYERLKLLPSDGSPQDFFGISVAIDGNFVLVGAHLDDTIAGVDAGSVCVFNLENGAFVRKITAPDASPNDEFGRSISAHDGKLIIGAHLDNGKLSNSGAAYVYNIDNGAFLYKILYPGNDTTTDSYFGYSVSISSNLLAAGAYAENGVNSEDGAVWIFDVESGNVVEGYRSNHSDSGGHNFGWSIDTDYSNLLVGAPRDNFLGFPGAALLIDTTLDKEIELVPNNDQSPHNQLFGFSVAISGPYAAISAVEDSSNGDKAGAVFIFDTTNGNELAKLFSNDISTGDEFGYSLDIDSNLLVVGSRHDDDNGGNSGSAYVFKTDGFQQTQKLLASDGSGNSFLGRSIAVSGNHIAVGATGESSNGPRSGAVYLYQMVSCDADLTDDGSLNFLDVSAFLAAYGQQDLIADFTDDGSLNFLDVSAFLEAFGVGCP
ncbi:MAG: FG-GAP repeat protein [Phycisphaerales bacterium]